MASNDSWFENVKLAPPIAVFELTAKYKEDTHPNKVNLSVGAYRDADGQPWVLPVVRTVESQLAADATLNHEYLPVAGLPAFREASNKLLLGSDSKILLEGRADSIQAHGGTGALRIGMDFLKTVLGLDTIYVSAPTWGNHNGIAKAAGFNNIKTYRYWDAANLRFNFEGMIEDLQNAPPRSVIILHACCHNPTGMDATPEQWKEIAHVIKEKQLFPFFDAAYQGFASGNLEQDIWTVRFFAHEGFELFVAQSFSKNFGLYNERVGNLCFISKSKETLHTMKSQMEIIIRTTWSNPSNHGGRVVATILNNPALCAEWKNHVAMMADRIKLMRDLLRSKLRALGTPGSWDHIVQQAGMFSYTGLSPRQCDVLINKYHIYVMKDGRINMCALTTKNADYVAQSIHEVVANPPDDPKL
jgi:aspartate aminotransferase